MRFFFFYLRHIALWSLFGVIGYWVWIDTQVANTLEGWRWDLPTRVYARPLELYVGAAVSRDRVIDTLRSLGYRAARAATTPGLYAIDGHTVQVHTRGFRFWDGVEPPRWIRFGIAGDEVRNLEEVGTDARPPLVRLEPAAVGTLHSSEFEDRVLLSRTEIPDRFVRVLLAVEDRRFHEHFGVDLWGVIRAAFANVRAGEVVQGGSTLTQQLAKNLYLSSKRSLWRKFNELLYALAFERRYTKNEILEAYVNAVYLGQDGNRAIHGFGLASKFYFGRPLEELNVGEVAALVGLIRGPSLYNPFKHHERAVARRNVVLALLKRRGVIDEATLREHTRAPLAVRGKRPYKVGRFPAFIDLVRRQLRRDYAADDLKAAGLNVFTTLDPLVAEELEAAVTAGVQRIEHGRAVRTGPLQVAGVVTDPDNGEVFALSGGRDAGDAGFNRALDARRPVGSLIKPFVYLTALSDALRFNVLTPISDEPVTWRDATGRAWTPRNFDGRVHGQVPLYQGLANSFNLATVNLGLSVGVERVADTLKAAGFDGAMPRYPSLFLGAVDMSPLEVSQIYQMLAAGGFRMPPRAIVAVTDSKNRPLRRYGLRLQPAVPGWAAYLGEYLMTRAVDSGTARSVAAALPRSLPLAGKTGTSNDSRDSWFAGYGRNYLGVIWVGYDDNRPTGLTGSSGALRVWIDLMRRLNVKPLTRDAPEPIAWQWMTPDGAARVAEQCEGALRVPMNADYLPDQTADCGGAPPDAVDPWPGIRHLFR